MIYDKKYYNWLTSFISRRNSPEKYSNLLKTLLDLDFIWEYPMDGNRATDGVNLRYRFIEEFKEDELYFKEHTEDTCSILEMMIALAIRCEDIMWDYSVGDRTSDWFWEMIDSLGLTTCTDDRTDNANYIYQVIEDFIYRNYEPNGRGGLFTVDENYDIRDREIWYQMQMYLNYIIERRYL